MSEENKINVNSESGEEGQNSNLIEKGDEKSYKDDSKPILDIDKEQQKEISSNKLKINISLVISCLALLLTAIQLILSSPQYLDSYNTPNLEVIEDYLIDTNRGVVTAYYKITNTSKKPANNIEIRFRKFKDDKFQFIPEISNVIRKDSENIPMQTEIYSIDNLVPQEQVILIINSSIKRFKESMGIDSLKANMSYRKPLTYYAPEIESVKSDKKLANIMRLKFIKFDKLNITGKASNNM